MACRLGFLWFSMTENQNFPKIFGRLPYQISTSLKKGMVVMVEAVLKFLVQISYEIHF
jgi:16S rRNA A1518/A1519 N6-dimethyltransferase RsmA/KsgA/DIM1 with predicted DNA glycosylase/AP lyase activity